MADFTPNGIMRRASALASDRSNFEDLWQQIAERMLPGSANFTKKGMPGEKQTEKMLDATAALAVRKYSTILESMMTPRNQKWHRLVAADPALEDSQEVKEYLDEVNTLLFKWRYAPQSNFAGQIGCSYLELGAFGTSSLFLDEEWDKAVQRAQTRYKAMPLAETYFAENHVGLIDTVYRKFEFTAAQAVGRWPEGLPSEITNAVAKSPDQKFCFYHCVAPSDGLTGDKLLRDHRFASIYISETGQKEVQRGGYYTFPFLLMRDLTSAGEVYGRSPGTWVLPDVKMLNDMNRTVIRAAQKVVDPPLMMTEDGALSGFNMRPGAANPGTLGPNGEELVRAFNSQARIDIGLEMMQAKQQTINEAFFITLFQILVDSPTMTATEVLERAQEKGMLLGPLAGRQQSEFLGPMVERELDLLYRSGRMPPPPQELLEAGGEYKIEYESPLARAQRAEEGVAIVRTLEALVPLAQLRPDVLDNFDLDETTRTLGEINGMAASLMRDQEDVDAMREERQQQQELMAAAQVAPGIAKGVKDLTDANATAQEAA